MGSAAILLTPSSLAAKTLVPIISRLYSMSDLIFPRWRVWMLLLASFGPPSAGGLALPAAEPNVAFDFARSVACTTLDMPRRGGPHDDHKTVEARFQVSARIVAGSLEDVDEIEIEIRSLTSQLLVDSFSPATEMRSEFAHPVEQTTSVEKTSTVGGSLGGSVSLPAGVALQVTPTIHGGTTHRRATTESATLVPPKTAAVVSGTLDAGHGAFFKIRRTSQTTLEGTHELAIRFSVPAEWQADLVLVRCRAKGTKTWLWLQQDRQWSATASAVALHLQGAGDARILAARKLRNYRRRCARTAGG